jgi:iron complex transport system substrate-binding protein
MVMEIDKKNRMDLMRIWNNASISIIDIRHKFISQENAVHEYTAPASIFIFTSSGKVKVILDGTVYQVNRFGIFHAGKGCKVSIYPKDYLEYSMIFYKAGEPACYKKEYAKLIKTGTPFQQQYGFSPQMPIFFTEQMKNMNLHWKEASPANHLAVKSIFYQIIFEIYNEIQNTGVCVYEPDLAATAMKYMVDNYNRPINIQEISKILGISYSHFHRIFKSSAGKSPQEYLIEIRLKNAKKFLTNKEFAIAEVANYCGFSDERNFRRSFLKKFGITPSAYRENIPNNVRDDTLENILFFPYNETSKVSDNKLRKEGEKIFMFNQMKNKTVAAIMLSMLLLSSCGTIGANTDSGNSTVIKSESVQEQQTKETESTKKDTRTVSTVMGDVEVPVYPQKIFVSDYAGDLLSFGITPAFSYTIYNNAPYESLIDSVTQVEDIETENIMSLEPDLIVVSYDSNYEDYSKIAPTIYIPYTTSVEDRIKLIGQVLGKEGEADKLMTDFYQKVEDTKQELTEAGVMDKTVTVLSIEGDTLYVYGDQFGRGGEILYSYLGLKAPNPIQKDMIGNPNQQWMELSLEALPEYCGDYIFLTTDSDTESSLESEPVWQNLDAVKNNRVFKKTIGFTLYKDYYSLNAMLDDFTKDLLSAK